MFNMEKGSMKVLLFEPFLFSATESAGRTIMDGDGGGGGGGGGSGGSGGRWLFSR